MDSDTINHVLRMMTVPGVKQLARTSNISEIKIISVTSSSRRDPARNMRLTVNLNRPYPLVCHKTNLSQELKRLYPEDFEETTQDGPYKIKQRLLDKYMFTSGINPKSCWPDLKPEYLNKAALINNISRSNLSFIFKPCATISNKVKKAYPLIKTNQDPRTIIKEMLYPYQMHFNPEIAIAVAAVKSKYEHVKHLGLEAIKSKITEAIRPYSKDINTNRKVYPHELNYVQLFQDPNMQICTASRNVGHEVDELKPVCDYLIHLTNTQGISPNTRKQYLQNLIFASKIGQEDLKDIIIQTNLKSISIDICKLVLNQTVSNETRGDFYRIRVDKKTTEWTNISFQHLYKFEIEGKLNKSGDKINIIFSSKFEHLKGSKKEKLIAQLLFDTNVLSLEVIKSKLPCLSVRIQDVIDAYRKVTQDKILNKDIEIKITPHYRHAYNKGQYNLKIENNLGVSSMKRGLSEEDYSYNVFKYKGLHQILKPATLQICNQDTNISEMLINIFNDYFSTPEKYNWFSEQYRRDVCGLTIEWKYRQIGKKIQNLGSYNSTTAITKELSDVIGSWDDRLSVFKMFILSKLKRGTNTTKEIEGVTIQGVSINPFFDSKVMYEDEKEIFIFGKRFQKRRNAREELEPHFHITTGLIQNHLQIYQSTNHALEACFSEGLIELNGSLYHIQRKEIIGTTLSWVASSIDARRSVPVEDMNLTSNEEEEELEEGEYDFDME